MILTIASLAKSNVHTVETAYNKEGQEFKLVGRIKMAFSMANASVREERRLARH
jgi:hypothetical protein